MTHEPVSVRSPMKGTYKTPHTSPNNMKNSSTTSGLDCVDKQLKKIQDEISAFNETLDKKLEEKLNNF